MAIEKRINIKVNTDDAVKNTERLANSLNKVDKEAENVNKSIDDVSSNGGAIAILDSLTGGLATQFKDAYEATKLFNFSLKGTRTALIATGVGAFVVALGAIVAYWDDIVELIEGANRKLQQQIDLNNENLEDLSFELKLLEAKEKILIAEGKSVKEIGQQKRQTILLQQEENNLLLENLRLQLEREKSQVREVTNWEKIKVATLEGLNLFEQANKARARAITGSDEDIARFGEIEKQIQDAQLRAEALSLALIELDKPQTANGTTQTDKTRDEAVKREQDRLKALSDFERELRRQDEDYYAQTEEEKLELERQRAQTELDNLIASEEEKREAQRLLNEYYDQLELDLEVKKYAEKEKLRQADLAKERKRLEEEAQLKEAVEDAKLSIADRTSQLIQEIAGKDSEVGKSLAVAQATISGIEGVQNAYTTAQKSPITLTFPAYPAIQAGLAGAFSALQIGKILSVDPSGKSTPSTSAGGVGGGAPSPSFNLISGSGTNQIAESIAGERAPLRAYVVSGEMSTQQALDRNIQDNASI